MTMRTKTLTLRLTEEELARIEEYADANYLSAASYVRRFILTELDGMGETVERIENIMEQIDSKVVPVLTFKYGDEPTDGHAEPGWTVPYSYDPEITPVTKITVTPVTEEEKEILKWSAIYDPVTSTITKVKEEPKTPNYLMGPESFFYGTDPAEQATKGTRLVPWGHA